MSDARVNITNLTKVLADELQRHVPEYQRRLNKAQVAALARDMDAGRWELSPDALSVVQHPQTGVIVALENGQHRVAARLKATTDEEIPVIILHRSTEDVERYQVIDTGRKRTFAEYLRAKRVGDEFQIAATVAKLYRVAQAEGLWPGGNEALSTAELAGWWENHLDQELVRECIKIARSVKLRVYSNVTTLSAIAYIASLGWDKGSTMEFFSYVRTGEDPEPGAQGVAPSRLLHDQYLRWKLEGRKARPAERVVWYTTVKALHLAAKGERPTRLLWRPSRDRELPIISDYMEANGGLANPWEEAE